MGLKEIDCFCNDCKFFERIQKGKAMAGFCSQHKQVISAKKQFIRYVAPFYSEDLGRFVIDRKTRFKLKDDCWEVRPKKVKE